MFAKKLVKQIMEGATSRFAQDAAPEEPIFPLPPVGTAWLVPIIPTRMRAVRDLVFKRTPQRPLMLDLFLPEQAPDKLLPIVVYVHGGGWVFGDKNHCPPVPLVERGFATASISYRYSSEAIYPAQIQDCKAAIRYLRAHAADHGLDPNRIGVWGHSAGGHLAALLGTTGNVKELDDDGDENLGISSAVQAVCDFCGPTDMMEFVERYGHTEYAEVDQFITPLLGGHPKENPDKVALANPIHFVNGDEPPFLIVQGGQDHLIPTSQSQRLHEALQRAGRDSTLEIIDHETHELFSFETEKVFRFFERTLG